MTPRRKTPAPSPGESALGPATVFDWLHAVAAGNYRQTPGIVDGQPRLTPEDYRRLAYRDPARGYPHPGLQNNPYLHMLREWMRGTLGKDVDHPAILTLIERIQGRRPALSQDDVLALTLEDAAQALKLVPPVRPLGLTDSHEKVLEALQARGPRAVLNADLEAAADLSRQTITHLLNDLCEWGLARRLGQRKGHVITGDGTALLGSLSAADAN